METAVLGVELSDAQPWPLRLGAGTSGRPSLALRWLSHRRGQTVELCTTGQYNAIIIALRSTRHATD